MASYLHAAMRGMEDRTVLVHAGDLVGASTPASGLLQDEPTVSFLNSFGNAACSYSDRRNADCNLVGTLGNHEFDEGPAELTRLLMGGNHANGPFLQDPWRGARFPTVSANVIDIETRAPWIDPFVVKKIAGIRVGFIGAVLKDVPSVSLPSHVAHLEFRDEAEAVNHYTAVLHAQGVRTIVLLLHQGGRPASESPTGSGGASAQSAPMEGVESPTGPGGASAQSAPMEGASIPLTGPIVDIVARLDPGIDVIISGHSHQLSRTLLKSRGGDDVLVAQAFSYGTAFDDVEMDIDARTGAVVAKSAKIVTAWADEGPGLTPDPSAAALVAAAEAKVGPRMHRVVGSAAALWSGRSGPTGESPLGALIAEAQRRAVQADFGFTNPGGIRADLPSGTLTWADLFAVQPFRDTVVKLAITGQQIYDVLNQQWQAGGAVRFLQVSGLEYSWSARRTPGDRVAEVRKDRAPIDRAASYTVAVNGYLAAGGDGFSAFAGARRLAEGPPDVDALAAHIQAQSQPIVDRFPRHILAVP